MSENEEPETCDKCKVVLGCNDIKDFGFNLCQKCFYSNEKAVQELDRRQRKYYEGVE